ncbi:heat shock protein HslJ [Sinobacterium caligoides]|uniref:Heat shock protein HslJ n=1 Tax=Sinobacterium caligoides TaxID=933926 RepID=A0A3N2E134_9GAMM|nr:META domain-containing protein [Sinobacterium caligoides]ROS05820.1 heat shock protein HslJ [Sinobacterium caligoides]
MKKILLAALIASTAACSQLNGVTDMMSSDSLVGKWDISSINNEAVNEDSKAYIEFGKDGKVHGNSSCNNFTGGFDIAKMGLDFGPIAGTRKLCDNAANLQETKLLQALPKVSDYGIEDGGLVLKDAEGNTLVKAQRQ